MSIFLVLLCILYHPVLCSEDVNFLCKCLNLLYVINELILCDLTMHSWHVCIVSHNSYHKGTKHAFLSYTVHVYYVCHPTIENQKYSSKW